MFEFSEERIDELLLWLSVNHDHVAQTRTPPTQRMRAALFESLRKCLDGLEFEEIEIKAPATSSRRDD
jgi:hypothetical protein